MRTSQFILTQDYLKSILHYDPSTGIFKWLITDRAVRAGMRAGTPCRRQDGGISGRHIQIKRRQYLEHRLAFLYMTGKMPVYVDHKDLNPLNNKWKNLRPATLSQNGANTLPHSRNRSGHKGVFFDQGRWRCAIQCNGRRIYLSGFETKEAAAAAYNAKAKELFGEFARSGKDDAK